VKTFMPTSAINGQRLFTSLILYWLCWTCENIWDTWICNYCRIGLILLQQIN